MRDEMTNLNVSMLTAGNELEAQECAYFIFVNYVYVQEFRGQR